ncbi:MAG: 30S ribosomal protein S5 [Nitrososphaerales archaeon]|nr:30S ribosomal protein S5 [Nitrososphaerales archaeon]
MMGRHDRREEEEVWVPRTKLGKLVNEGKVTSLEELFKTGQRVREAEIVKKLLPELRNEVVGVSVVQKQTDAGELTRFAAVVAVGNGAGWFGVGRGKAMQTREAIDKATNNALLNIIPVKLGCGSWECRCGRPHSVPYKIKGKAGSVTIEIIPGPRALGLVAGPALKNLLQLAGVKDAWIRTFGSTSTMSSLANAAYDAFRMSHGLNV